AADAVAVVARLADDDAVAALRHARRARAVGLPAAVVRAAVEGQGVAILAALRPFDHAVAALRGRADARAAAALPADLDLAGRGAAVACGRVTVVAELGQDLHAVATARDPVAGLPGGLAREPRLDDEAIRRAPVARHLVAVVARLVARPLAVSAPGRHPRVQAHDWTRRAAAGPAAGTGVRSDAGSAADSVAGRAPRPRFHRPAPAGDGEGRADTKQDDAADEAALDLFQAHGCSKYPVGALEIFASRRKRCRASVESRCREPPQRAATTFIATPEGGHPWCVVTG